MYKCKYFAIKELVHPKNLKISEDILWLLLDERVLKLADKIREKYGACYINTSQLKECGLRDINSTTGAKYSQHKFGRALDLHIMAIEKKNLTHDQKTKEYNKVRQELIKDKEFDELNFENNIYWLHCLDQDTEILTENGFKHYYEISKTEKVINYNINKNILEQDNINNIIIQKVQDYQLYGAKTQGVDYLVTDEHQMLYRKIYNNVYKKAFAKDIIQDNLYLPVAGILDYSIYLKFPIELLKLAIATTCDGYIHHKYAGKGNVIFHLMKQRKVNEIINLLNKLNYKYTVKNYDYTITNNKNTTIYISCKDSQNIFDIIDKDKNLPLWFIKLPLIIKQELLKEWAFFDGTTHQNRLQIDNNNEYNIDILQIMAITSNYKTLKTISSLKGKRKPCFRLSLQLNKNYAVLKKQSFYNKKYSGIVWCLNTNNGTLFIRRNGKCLIVGNCDVGNRKNRLFNP